MLRTRPATSTPGHRIHPYLLRDRPVVQPNQVWCADITYVPLCRWVWCIWSRSWTGFSRYVLAWEVSSSLEGSFCCAALDDALQQAQPQIFNTDQGSQFTAQAFTRRLEAAGVQISMDGRGRVFDNIFVERLWRSVKYEHLYLHDYQTLSDGAGCRCRGACLYGRLQHETTPPESGVSDACSGLWGLQSRGGPGATAAG